MGQTNGRRTVYNNAMHGPDAEMRTRELVVYIICKLRIQIASNYNGIYLNTVNEEMILNWFCKNKTKEAKM